MSSAETVPSRSPSLLFQRLRWRRFVNTLRHLVGHSLIRPITILLCSLLVWGFVFFVSYEGFAFMQLREVPLTGGIIGVLFDLLFLTLAVMLIFSTGIILYSSLFGSAETSFLLSSPTGPDHIFAFKYQGAIAFSSWAFILLASPILIAYGIVVVGAWHFYVLLLLFFLGFVLLPGSLGAVVTLLLVNFLPQKRKQIVITTILLLLGLAVFVAHSMMSSIQKKGLSGDLVEQMLGRFGMATGSLVPSHWISQGLIASARDELGKALYYLALIWSNGLIFYVVAVWLAKRLYRRGYNRISTGGTLRRHYDGHRLDRLLERALFFIDPKTRLLIIKDFRTFRRDPSQWLQVLLFCGLMMLYFLNIRRVLLNRIDWNYQIHISGINLSATAFLLCAYTGRFVYPLLSLEGRKFWILGLLPLERERLLWGKFAFASTGSLIIAETLILVSDLMLGMPVLAILLHMITIAVLAIGLSGLSVGLGALMPNFRETDPSKIAVGFGGTLNLVVGLLFLVAVMGLMTGPWHLFAVLQGSSDLGLFGIIVIGVGVAAGAILGVIAVVIPLRLGARNLKEMEF